MCLHSLYLVFSLVTHDDEHGPVSEGHAIFNEHAKAVVYLLANHRRRINKLSGKTVTPAHEESKTTTVTTVRQQQTPDSISHPHRASYEKFTKNAALSNWRADQPSAMATASLRFKTYDDFYSLILFISFFNHSRANCLKYRGFRSLRGDT